MKKQNTGTTIFIGLCALIGMIVVSFGINTGIYWLLCYCFNIQFTLLKAVFVYIAVFIIYAFRSRKKEE